MRSLLLATDFGSQYRAMRCLAALSDEVWVAGPKQARSLAVSRYCRGFKRFDFDLSDPVAAAAQLDEASRETGADLIVPGDMRTAVFLARVKPHLTSPAFPVADPAALEALGTKDRFMETCRRLGVPHPQGQIFENAAALKEALVQGRISLPAMLKPLNMAGGNGVQRIDSRNAEREIAHLAYAPILAQQFVEGTDRCISLFCRNGQVLKQVVYEHAAGEFRFLKDNQLEGLAASIASALNFTGLMGFDARIDADGNVWMIECNPRFTFNMDVAMVAGLNFADWAEPSGAAVRSQTIRLPKALLRAILRLQWPSRADFRMLAHWLKDPLMFGLVALGYRQRWRLPLFESVMTRGKCVA